MNKDILLRLHANNEAIRALINKRHRQVNYLDRLDSTNFITLQNDMKVLCKNYPIEWSAFQQRDKELKT